MWSRGLRRTTVTIAPATPPPPITQGESTPAASDARDSREDEASSDEESGGEVEYAFVPLEESDGEDEEGDHHDGEGATEGLSNGTLNGEKPHIEGNGNTPGFETEDPFVEEGEQEEEEEEEETGGD